MSFDEYLLSTLGEEKYHELLKALKSGRTIIVSGVNGSGKTTLAKILRKKGYNVIEDFETYGLVLDKKLNDIVPNKESEIL